MMFQLDGWTHTRHPPCHCNTGQPQESVGTRNQMLPKASFLWSIPIHQVIWWSVELVGCPVRKEPSKTVTSTDTCDVYGNQPLLFRPDNFTNWLCNRLFKMTHPGASNQVRRMRSAKGSRWLNMSGTPRLRYMVGDLDLCSWMRPTVDASTTWCTSLAGSSGRWQEGWWH